MNSIKNKTQVLMMRKLKIETFAAIRILDENVEKEWRKLQKIANERKKLKEIYDLFYSRLI